MTKARMRRGEQETDRPGQRLAHDADDGGGIVGDRIAEVEPGDAAEIGQVLLPQRLVEPEPRWYSATISRCRPGRRRRAAACCSSLARDGSCR